MSRVCLIVALTLVSAIPVGAQVRTPKPPEVLAAEGGAAMQAGRFRDAFDAFAAAAHARPRDVSLYVAAANAAAMLGQLADAQRWVERSLQINSAYTPGSILLGQILYRLGKLPEAVSVYEAALTHAPTNATLVKALIDWKREVELQSRFFERRGAHFSVLFEGPADEAVAKRIIDILEDAYYRIGTTLMTFPSDPITVVLYTGQQFQDVTRSPAWAAAVYDGRIKVPVGGALKHEQELRRVVEHEFVHAVVNTMAGRTVPTWLHEGLAMVLEEGGGANAERVLSMTTARVPLSMLSRGFTGMGGVQAAIAYGESVRAVKRMIALRGMPAVVSLLHALGRGADFASAFQLAIFMRFEDFEAELARP